MQGQRTIQSYPETFEFDSSASSSNSVADQQFYWNNMINPVETQNLPDYLLTSGDASAVGHVNGGLNGWSLEGPSSSEHMLNQEVHDEVKMDHMWTSPLTINPASGSRLEEGRLDEAAGVLSLESVNISLHNNQVANEPLFFQDSSVEDTSRNSNLNAGFVGNGLQTMEAGSGPHLYNKHGMPATEQMASGDSSADPGGIPAGIGGSLAEDNNGRPGCAMDGRRIPCKRKNLEGVSGQSSLGASPSYFQRDEDNSPWHTFPPQHNAASSLSISMPAEHLSGVSSVEQLNTRVGVGISGVAPDCHPGLTGGGNAESSHRSFRMRVNPTNHQDSAPPHLWFAGNNSVRQTYVWPPHPSPSSRLLPLNYQSLDLRPAATSSSSQGQSNLLHLPVLQQNMHPFSWNGASNLRIGSSSGSPVILGERPVTLREEVSSARNTPRSMSEHAMFAPVPEMRHLRQDLVNWGPNNGSINIPGSIASSSRIASNSEIRAATAAAWPRQVPLAQFPRRSEVIRRSASSVSESTGQGSLLPPLRTIPSASSSEGGQPSAAAGGPHGHLQQYMRSALLMDRLGDGIPGVPLSLRTLAAPNDGRSRLVSEIRNVLDLIRRGENFRFEDVLIFDQSGSYHSIADLHDRHRDMRLDVDNMSYEELLALEERIGNVSTGLSEETVMKCLKQRKYFAITNEASRDVEPCCICQEEYVEEDELGILDCGHDFHSICIKQWLKHKNLCPICKTTALVT